MDLERIFYASTSFQLIGEIILRCIIMYLLIISILRMSGKRGVRQLSIFEIAIILSLGSAAGDPMFIQDIPLFHALLVFICIIALYRLTTWLMMKNQKVEKLLEGEPIYIVEDGLLVLAHVEKETMSHDEFFAELRQQNVEHLGQVRVALLETNGVLSILFYEDEEVKYGLPIFPKAYKKLESITGQYYCACMFCSNIQHIDDAEQLCERCKRQSWTTALDNIRQ